MPVPLAFQAVVNEGPRRVTCVRVHIPRLFIGPLRTLLVVAFKAVHAARRVFPTLRRTAHREEENCSDVPQMHCGCSQRLTTIARFSWPPVPAE